MASYLSRWLPLTGLSLFAALAIWLTRPPRPLPATAPANEFSAYRAQHDVAVVASQRHPVGSVANAQVRAYLLRRCRELGLAPTVLDTTALMAKNGEVTVGHVQDIIARLPGRQPGGKAVLVLAHYDSQPQSPGAGDDGAGVAAMLETIRALRAGPPLAHDVIWLFTDGEEAGLLGARAYAADTARLRREVGVALNFEGRGNAGPSLTFEVSPQNGWVIREYARTAPVPIASSLFYEAYRNLPNDTDFTPLRQAGITGLNFAYSDGYPYYHSPADTPAHLDLSSLQHQGSYMLSLVRHFGTISLTQTKEPDYTFFNPLGSWLVRYPAAWNLPLTSTTLVLLLATIGVAGQRRRLGRASLLGGFVAWVGCLLLMLAAGWGLLALVAATYPNYHTFYGNAAYNALTYQIALLALGTAIFAGCYGWLGRHVRPDALVGGALLVVALLLGLLQWRAASSAFLLSLPLLAATLAWGLRLRRATTPASLPGTGPVTWALALPAVALLVPTTYFVLITFALTPLVLLGLLLLALLLGLLLPCLLPVLAAPAPGSSGAARGWGLSLLALAGVLVALAVGHATRLPTADQPQQTHLYYALDADQGHAYWLSAATQPDAWTKQLLTQPQYQPLPALFPGQRAPVLHQAAPALALASPTIRLLADSTRAGHRHLRLLVGPGRPLAIGCRVVLMSAAPLRRLRVADHLVPAEALAKATGLTTLSFVAPHPAGEVVELETTAPGPVRVIVTTRTAGLPLVPGLPALPNTIVPAPGFNSFTTQVEKTFGF